MIKRSLIILAWCQILTQPTQADVKLPSLFSDNALLQAGKPVPVWGMADSGEKVTVRFAGQVVESTAAADGRWSVTLKPIKAGFSGKMAIDGKNSVVINNVLVGTVWVCSGQSNMENGMRRVRDAKEEIAKANYPKIRLFLVKRTASIHPLTDVEAHWVECSPETVVQDGWQGFSAVAYFFGRAVHQATGQPVGLIESSWGGTPAQSWTSLDGLRKVPELREYVATTERTASNMPAFLAKYAKDQEEYPRTLAHWQETARKPWEAAVLAWEQDCVKAKLEHKPAPAKPKVAVPRPELGLPPDKNHLTPSSLFNGMIAPLIPYAIEGVIWYQGESNGFATRQAREYRKLFPALIQDWRSKWGQGDFPFYYCQLANFKSKLKDPAESDWAEIREAQRQALSLPNTGMAVLIDIGEAGDIHPLNKQDVGDRLARIALSKHFGRVGRCSGPSYRSMALEGGKIRLNFDPEGGELVAGDIPNVYPLVLAKGETKPLVRNRPGSQLEGFSIAEDVPDSNPGGASSRKWVWADAVIEGASVLVSSPEIKVPVAVRYGWADNPTCNLFNKEGLPCSPFQTDAPVLQVHDSRR